MPTYLGTVVFIFCLLCSGIGDSQESEDIMKDLRPCSAGDICNSRVNRGAPGKREARRVVVFSSALFSGLFFFLILFFFLTILHIAPLASLTVRIFHHREGRMRTSKGRRKTVEAQTITSEWTSLRRGAALCWCGLNRIQVSNIRNMCLKLCLYCIC